MVGVAGGSVLAGVAAEGSTSGTVGVDEDPAKAVSREDGADQSESPDLSCAKLLAATRRIAPSKNAACLIAYLP
jgi:hypothetical protein